MADGSQSKAVKSGKVCHFLSRQGGKCAKDIDACIIYDNRNILEPAKCWQNIFNFLFFSLSQQVSNDYLNLH
jgi:hypothetical protein